MFRMEFQSHVSEEDDDEDNTSDSITESLYKPAIFEGRVGHFCKVHRVSQSIPNGSFREAELMDSGYSPVCKGVTQDETSQQAIFLDAQVLWELVRPFTALHHGTVINVSGEDESPSSSISSGFSMRSDSSSFRSDISSPSEGSVAALKALQREGKPWEEPLLALHQQNEVAAAETRRRDEEQRCEAVTTQRELRDLANCVEFSPSHGFFKKNKLQKILHKTGVAAVYRFFKVPFSLFKSPRIHNGYATQEGVHSPVMPPRRVVSEYYLSSSNAAAVLQMRTASPARSAVIEFATVNSTQRDVPAWTMEEYMRKNGRVHQWRRRIDDAEFGGIEGNNLMNQNFDDAGMHATYSDSDSD